MCEIYMPRKSLASLYLAVLFSFGYFSRNAFTLRLFIPLPFSLRQFLKCHVFALIGDEGGAGMSKWPALAPGRVTCPREDMTDACFDGTLGSAKYTTPCSLSNIAYLIVSVLKCLLHCVSYISLCMTANEQWRRGS